MFLNVAALSLWLVVCMDSQYLKDEDEDLVSPPNINGNQWLKFLQESKHLKGKL